MVGDRLFTAYRTTDESEGEEVFVALQRDDGETIWERRADAPFAEYHKLEHGVGPHVTPTAVGGRVFFAGIYGDLVAVDGESGELVWKKELIREMGGTEDSRGYTCSPLAHEGRLIVTVGGEGQTLVALDQRTGEIVWQNGDMPRGHSSPDLIEVDGQEQIVLLNREELLGLDPSNGERLWSYDHPVSFGLSISVPTWYPDDKLLFMSTAYNGGSRAFRLERQGDQTQVEQLWAHKQMRIHIGNAIRVGDVVWGANGDFGAVPFTGVHIETGDIVHRTRDIARAFHVLADGKLVILDEDGVLTLATPRSDDLEIHAQAEIFETRSWTPPTLVGRTLFARDQKEIVSLELP